MIHSLTTLSSIWASWAPACRLRARSNSPATTGSRSFFIVLAPAPNLDGKYSIFGKIVDGFDTLDNMEKVRRGQDGQTQIEKIELIEAVIKL